jgi:hypothetical protein
MHTTPRTINPVRTVRPTVVGALRHPTGIRLILRPQGTAGNDDFTIAVPNSVLRDLVRR